MTSNMSSFFLIIIVIADQMIKITDNLNFNTWDFVDRYKLYNCFVLSFLQRRQSRSVIDRPVWNSTFIKDLPTSGNCPGWDPNFFLFSASCRAQTPFSLPMPEGNPSISERFPSEIGNAWLWYLKSHIGIDIWGPIIDSISRWGMIDWGPIINWWNRWWMIDSSWSIILDDPPIWGSIFVNISHLGEIESPKEEDTISSIWEMYQHNMCDVWCSWGTGVRVFSGCHWNFSCNPHVMQPWTCVQLVGL